MGSGCILAYTQGFQASWLPDGVSCTSPSRVARPIGFGFGFGLGANNKRLPSDDAIDFRHFCATHTLLEVHEGLRAVLTGVCKEIPHGFQA
jgi:hypothetical protein